MPTIVTKGTLSASGYGFSIGGASPSKTTVAVTFQSSPYLNIYDWSSSTGFGSKYSDPLTLPSFIGSFGNNVAYTPDNKAVIVCGPGGTPYVAAYPWSGTGFGAKFSDPSSAIPGGAYGVAARTWSVGITKVAVVYSAVSPYVSSYDFSTSSGWGTKGADPSTPPNSGAIAVCLGGNQIFLATSGSPYVYAYAFGGGVIGFKYADPSTLPTGVGRGIATDGGFNVAVAHSTSPYITVYPFSGGFGTKYSDPGTLPAGTGYACAFSPDRSYLAIAHDTSPYITVYPFASGFGAKISNPATLPTGNGRGVAFSSAGDAIAISHSTSPFVTAYPWSGSFGTKYSNPSTLPAGGGSGVAFSPTGA